MKRAWFANDVPSNSTDGLKNLVKDIPKRSVLLEVGTLTGVSAIVFARRCSKVFTVDGWGMLEPYGAMTKERLIEAEERYHLYIKRFRKIKNKIVQIKDFSVSAANKFRTRSLDIVYIDGNHFYDAVKTDLDTWLPKIKKGGIICGGAYQIDHVAKAIEDVFSEGPDKVYEDGSWLINL